MNLRRTRRLFAVAGTLVVVTAALVTVLPATPSRAADDVSETRAVSGFDRVRLRGPFTTEITAGEHASHVVVTASRDDIGRVTTEVENGTLEIGMRSGNNSLGRAPKLTIELPVLRGFANEGAGSVKISGLTGGDITLENDGAASIVAAGRAARLEITLNGTGRLDTTAVRARDVSVDNNGVGSIRVRASGALTMNVNGVGEIRYTGDPVTVEKHVNGIGSIEPI